MLTKNKNILLLIRKLPQHLKGVKSHSIIQSGIETLVNMTHRGAEGADSKTGDGAGILIQIPRDFYLMQGYSIPHAGQFGTGLVFLPQGSTGASFSSRESRCSRYRG